MTLRICCKRLGAVLLRPQRVSGLGERRQRDPVPAVATLLLRLEQPPYEVVLVPSRHDHDHDAAGPRGGCRRRLVPVPHGLAVGLAAGLLAVLDRVLDQQHVRAVASDGAAHADRDVAAREARDVPAPRCRGVIGRRDSGEQRLILGRRDHVAGLTPEGVRKVGGVGTGHDAAVRVAAEIPGREPHRGELALPVARRRLDQHAIDDAAAARGVGAGQPERRSLQHVADLPVQLDRLVAAHRRGCECGRVLLRCDGKAVALGGRYRGHR